MSFEEDKDLTQEQATPAGDKKRKIILIALIAAAVILIAALTLVLVMCAGGNNADDGAATTTANAAADDYIIYWNVDREKYAGQSSTGMSSREPNEDTGYFQITFAMEGRQAIRRVSDRRVVNKIDNMDMMGLVLDENGIIVDVQSIEEFTGGYAVNKFFVEGINDNVITLNSSNTLKGMQVDITLEENTKIYDVTGETGDIGCSTGLFEMDSIIAIQNKSGEITHVYVVQREPQGPTATHYCDHCKQEVTWRAWVYESTLPTSGSNHYYLYNDITLSGQMSMAADTEIILNLNGKTVTGNGANRMYSLHNKGAYLAIMDYSEKADGKLKVTGKISGQGGCVWVRYGKFEMWSGILDASDCTNAMNGVAVCVDGASDDKSNSVFNFYGGTIIGGTAQTQFNKAAGTTSGGVGGAIMNMGEFNMYGGTIKGGKAKSVFNTKTQAYAAGCGGNVANHTANAVFNMYGGTISGGTSEGAGGNIWMNAKSTVNIFGGTITGGETKRAGVNGGNVFNNGCTLNISGGTIKNGITRNCGANVYSNNQLTISGGYITGGKKLDSETGKEVVSANTNAFIVNGVTAISGGKIDGHVQLIATGDNKVDITLSGNPVIYGAAEGNSNLLVPSGTLLKVGKLKSGAKIGVTASGVFSEKTDEANKQYFSVDNSTVKIAVAAGCLCVGEAYEKCLCGSSTTTHLDGCNGELLAWMAWGNSTSLPTSGNYYLTGDVTLSNKSFTNAKVNIALNGYSIKGGTNRPIQLRQGTEMVLTSWGKSGSTVSGTVSDGDGGLVLMHVYKDDGEYTKDLVAPKLTAFGVTFDASKVTKTKNGGAISFGSKTLEDKSVTSCEVKLSGCTVKGATITGNGGAIYVSGAGKLTMVNTNITGGTVAPTTSPDTSATVGGGSLYVNSAATVTITGGTISGGKVQDIKNLNAYGGNILSFGTLTMNNVTVQKGESLEPTDVNTVARGGNVYINGGTFVANNCTIKNGYSHWQGGNVVVDGASTKATFTLCTIDQGNSDNQGENMAVFNGEVNLNGTYVGGRPSTDTTKVSNIFINGSNAKVNFSSYIDKDKVETETHVGMGISIFNISSMKLTGKMNIYQIGLGGAFKGEKLIDMSGLTSGSVGFNTDAEYMISTNLSSTSTATFASRNTAYEIVVDGTNVKIQAVAAS